MKNQFAKIVAVLMVLAMAVSVFGLCASAAETTTEANTTVILGDVNLNGKVTISDATLIQKALAKLATLDEVQTAAAEVTEDGNVNIKDVTMIQKWLANYEDVNQNIGKPMATADEATPEESTPEEPTPDEKPVVPSTPEESTPEESTPEETPVDPSTKDEETPADPEVPADPATKDEPAVEPENPVVPENPATGDEATADEPTTTYNVAGSEGLCGVNWDPSANQMTYLGNGVWEITFENVAAGSYEFKVVEGGAWNNPDYNLEGSANGKGNAVVEVAADGSTVVIGFDGTKAYIG